MLRTHLAGEAIDLHETGALHWCAASTLFVADTHFGKPAAFRAAGLPAPEALTANDLDRLARALDDTRAQRLVVLGDLLHHRTGRDPNALGAVAQWRAARAELDILVVRGNHDLHAGDPPDDWRMRIEPQGRVEPPFVFRHEPTESDDGYALAGHIHPVASLAAPGVGRARFRCFLLGERCAVLPAFAQFAGGAPVRTDPGDRLVLLTPDGLCTLDAPAPSRAR
ncbi:MAG: ligase-associated DNA damage response endonuclease PdeM [Phycisphaerales bacterium]